MGLVVSVFVRFYFPRGGEGRVLGEGGLIALLNAPSLSLDLSRVVSVRHLTEHA